MSMTQTPLQYRGYSGSVDASVEDGVVYGKLLFIDDLVTYEADTERGIGQAFREAVDDYLETCAVLGRSPQQPPQ